MRNSILIAVISLALGALIGAKVMESFGRSYIMANLPVPSGTLNDKDVFLKSIPENGELVKKDLVEVNKKAKNVILLIGDGMSASQITSYRLLKEGPNGRIAVDNFPISGIVLTHSADAIITDSASSATAYSTGSKTKNGFLGVDQEGQILENLTEKLDKFGFVSALISTSEVTHATPAAFFSHVDSRRNTDEISSQMLESKVATILGGGRKFFLSAENGGKRKDKRDLLEEAKKSHKILMHKHELDISGITPSDRVLGLFAGEHLRDEENPDNHSSEPTLTEMLRFSLERAEAAIDNQCRGSFIMVEGSQVDWAGHANNIDYLERELKEFDEATRYALEYAKKNPDTLVVVTADHETGGLLIEPIALSYYTGNNIKFSFNTAIGGGSHTGVPVPVYAYGPGSLNFSGTLDNTDVYRAILSALDLTEQTGSCL
ncbi:alkaline phosphatase [Gammaproteobacteria bacterium]|nr:alkaline phosphatase [Gammaproteobacteria bacterium]